jgi:hypothetical protein
MELVRILVAALLFPGVLTALALGVILRVLRGRGAPSLRGVARNRETLAALASIALAGLGLALLPWPQHPVTAPTAWLGAWALFELAFALLLLPALCAGTPSVVRAAVRALQMGAFARALLWAALATMLIDPTAWSPATALLRLIALAAALAALLPAVGWGPFSVDPNMTPEGSALGLPPATQALLAFAQDVRCAALLAAILVAGLPTQVGPPWLGLLQVLAGFVVVVLGLRRLDGYLPRITLRTALRFSWIVIAPLTVGAVLLATGLL